MKRTKLKRTPLYYALAMAGAGLFLVSLGAAQNNSAAKNNDAKKTAPVVTSIPR